MTPPDVTMKLLVEGDAGVLERVAVDVFDHPVRAEFVGEFLEDRRSLIAVAIDDGTVVGMATGVVHGHPDKPLQLFINEVGISPAYRRRGIASRLVRLLLERGRAMGCAEAWVATEEENAEARALYASIGGREERSRAVVFTYELSATEPSG